MVNAYAEIKELGNPTMKKVIEIAWDNKCKVELIANKCDSCICPIPDVIALNNALVMSNSTYYGDLNMTLSEVGKYTKETDTGLFLCKHGTKVRLV